MAITRKQLIENLRDVCINKAIAIEMAAKHIEIRTDDDVILDYLDKIQTALEEISGAVGALK